MKKRRPVFFAVLSATALLAADAGAQPNNATALKKRLALLEKGPDYRNDTAYINARNRLAFVYAGNYPDSAISLLADYVVKGSQPAYKRGEAEAWKIVGTAYQKKGDYARAEKHYQQAYTLAQKNGLDDLVPGVLNNIGLNYLSQGNHVAALENFYAALKGADARGDRFVAGRVYNSIANVHFYQGKMADARNDYNQTLRIAKETADTAGITLAYNNLGEVAIETKDFPAALENLTAAYNLALQTNNKELQVASTKNLGTVYLQTDSAGKAISYFNNACQLALQAGNRPAAGKALIGLAKAKQKTGALKEALKDALTAVQLAQDMGKASLQRDANEVAASVYESMGNGALALRHYKIFKQYADSLHSLESERMATRLQAEFDFSKKELEFQRRSLQQRWLIISAGAGLLVLIAVIWLVNRNRKREHRSNVLLQRKNTAIENQKGIAEKALEDLRAAQQQLVQHEKMASLGELTAGIAHEIQNPLNFVNNFSVLNQELLAEMKEEIANKNYGDVDLLAANVEANEEKIAYHGKRADGIIKSMLLHSRGSSGSKEPTDINALADEFLRLSYHGLRAKDPGFNAAIKTDYDPAIGRVPVSAQEMGRVLLNLYNNAFYSVDEKKKRGEAFEPVVSVQTKKDGGRVFVFVRDNGTGIPQGVAEKIFQPFFTTKPTGKGTGLGLSLSYDIVTKQHNGKLSVQSKEGEGAAFVIELPVA